MSAKVMPLAQAIAAHVRPGMHLHFASTPSRSNAAIRELARCFQGTSPGFVLSTTGFHSLAHLLAVLRLGRRYIACFFGDNYPAPRPNALYTSLLNEGATLEHWSLWSYVTALRAGALGLPYGLTRSLAGTTLGAELAAAGAYVQVPDPADQQHSLGLVRAMRPDVTFLHGLLGDAQGNVVFSPPYAEGFWGALGARQGTIVTVERLVAPEALAAFQSAIKLPAQRVLAVCVEPYGAHPQPLYAEPGFGMPGYPDDFEHYELWRAMAGDGERFERFAEQVLRAQDGAAGYQSFVGAERLDALASAATPAMPLPESLQRFLEPPPATAEGPQLPPDLAPEDRLILRAAQTIAARVRERGYRSVLAGIGQAFFAARLAHLWLAREGIELAVMVETGLFDLECGPAGNRFLLSYDNIARARRLSSVEDVLGTLACGADNRCLGVVGAAQIDPQGNINSTRLADGRLLVGSGGANDIASACDEVIVLVSAGRSRLVPQVDYSTSPGRAVLHIVTDLCTLRRETPEHSVWSIQDLWPAPGAASRFEALTLVREACGWDEHALMDLAPDQGRRLL